MKGTIRGKPPKLTYLLDGVEVTEEEFDKAFPPGPVNNVGGSSPAIRNHPSDALAVHPDQVNEAREDAVKRGVPTEFLRDGRPIMRDRAHQKRYLRCYGFYNRDGSYGD